VNECVGVISGSGSVSGSVISFCCGCEVIVCGVAVVGSVISVNRRGIIGVGNTCVVGGIIIIRNVSVIVIIFLFIRIRTTVLAPSIEDKTIETGSTIGIRINIDISVSISISVSINISVIISFPRLLLPRVSYTTD